jgi:2-methylisocitrate lyase-like PEP mutase family enzyme
LPFSRLRELGYAVILLPVDTLFVAVRAMEAFLGALKDADATAPLADRYVSFQAFNDLIGVGEQFALGERYSA